MASRTTIAKLLQEIRGFAEVTNRQPRNIAVWFTDRPQIIRVAPARRCVQLQIEVSETAGQPVAIRHAAAPQRLRSDR